MDHSIDRSAAPTDEFENVLQRRHAFQSRHCAGLTKLMEERNDLRGVHALADLVDDAIRWTA